MTGPVPVRPVAHVPCRRRWLAGAAVVLVAIGAGRIVSAEEPVVVIVHRDNPFDVDREFVRRVYLGTERGWPDGSPVFALDQPEDSDVRRTFCTAVLGRSVANVRAIWSQNIFTGRGMPPKLAPADAEMKRIVSLNRNAIGYVRASQLDATVRAVGR